MNQRRSFVLATGATALGAALVVPHAFGQSAKQARRVALLTTSSEARFASSLQAVRDGLREHGYAEGRDIVIDIRYADGREQELPRLAAELAALKPAVIIAPGSIATDAALAATVATPIVTLGDPVAAGHAASLGRPGGRVTGISFLLTELNAKRLELLSQLLPKGSAVLNLADPLARNGDMQVVEDAGRSLGLVTHAAYARTPAEIETALTAARSLRVAGINVLNSPFLYLNRLRIMEFAAAARLPAIYQWPEAARDGGLMGYGPSIIAMFRQLGGYASRILGGAKPADLAVEQPTRFELVINKKSAKALGITIPTALLLRVDEVIE
jgi:putative tryptophan/tyrosine transport system substrate-binding protein